MAIDSETVPLGEPLAGRVRALRPALLRLHKSLLDYERGAYEKSQGRSVTPGELVRLAMFDPWFSWLRRISEMIVRIDELLENEDARMADASTIFEEARSLFRPGAEGSEFQARYKAALQKDASSVLAHVDVQKALFADS